MIEDQVTSIQQAVKEEIDKSKNIIFNGLLNDDICASMPESVFVNYFLPCIVGTANNPNWVLEWVSIAGSPMAAVKVVKDGTDEILYMVPGIFTTNNLVFSNDRGNIADIFGRYEQLNNNISSQGTAFLMDALSDKSKEVSDNISLTDAAARWLNILNRYNINTPKNDTPANTAEVSEDYFE